MLEGSLHNLLYVEKSRWADFGVRWVIMAESPDQAYHSLCRLLELKVFPLPPTFVSSVIILHELNGIVVFIMACALCVRECGRGGGIKAEIKSCVFVSRLIIHLSK